MDSLPVAPAAGNVAATVTAMPLLTFSPFQEEATPDFSPPLCEWLANGHVAERWNLIGQMQDSSGKGSVVDWEYKSTADSTFGVGVSGSPAKHYSLDGHFSITNNFGGSGGFSEGPGFDGFVYGHFYRQRYRNLIYDNGHPACGHKYKTYYPNAIGDSYPQGKKKPAKDILIR